MRLLQETSSTARIEVQRPFCKTCSSCIHRELQKIEHIDNIKLYPKDSIIAFNFTSVNQVSTVRNLLSDIGYYEKGDCINHRVLSINTCRC